MGIDLPLGTPTAGGSSVLWFRPGHGCEGDATNAVAVTLPDGFAPAKAQPKAGWTLTSDGRTFIWSRGVLPDDQYDQFGIRLTWPAAPAGSDPRTYYFPTVQVCNAELKVATRSGIATIAGYLPQNRGEKVDLLVDGKPLTKHPVVVGPDGRFSSAVSAALVPDGSEVTAERDGQLVGTSIAGTEAWTQIPVAGSSATLDSPAPSVTVASAVK